MNTEEWDRLKQDEIDNNVSACGALLHIVHTDPLSADYSKAFRQAGIRPPHTAYPFMAEQLAGEFQRDFFDIVFCTNALEHCANPLVALFNMLAVLRTGGICILRHGWKNGLLNNYQGLHRWDLWCQDDHMMISREEHDIDASFWLETLADSEAWIAGDGRDALVHARFTKR